MKRLLCFVFIFSINFVGIIFDNNDADFFNSYNYNIKSIIVVSDNNLSKDNQVINGNDYILKIDNVNNILNNKYKGIIFSIDKNINIDKLIKDLKIKILETYIIDGNVVIDGKVNFTNFKSVQMVIKNEEVVIGFPSILNGF